MHRYFLAILIGCLLLGSGLAVNASEGSDAGQPACPEPRSFTSPAFPPDLLRRGASGTVELEMQVDSCGRVTAVEVVRGSRYSQFDESAVASVRDAVLDAAQMEQASDGLFRMQVDFAKPRDITPRKLDWPKSHRRPAYHPDERPLGFDSVAEAEVGIRAQTSEYWQSPYPERVSRAFQVGTGAEREVWIFLGLESFLTVARFRPVIEDEEAIVRVSILCEDTSESCEQTRSALMEGLPFARPR